MLTRPWQAAPRVKGILIAEDCIRPAPSVPLDCRRTRGERSMPVTVVLSRKFYEKFGDDITNELVDWFNKVDHTYRTELRELNELNFGRFDAKLGALASGMDTRM